MLLNFKVSNFRSIKEEMNISFIAEKNKELEKNLIISDVFKKPVLNGIGVFGPNGSGKSNLLRAISAITYTIIDGPVTRHQDKEDYFSEIQPFLFEENAKCKPSSFMLDYIIDEKRFVYCIELDGECIYSEKLYTYYGKTKLLIYKIELKDKKKYKLVVGSKVTNAQKKVLYQVKEWAGTFSFLKTIAREKNEQLDFIKPAYEWFKKINVITPYRSCRDMGYRVAASIIKKDEKIKKYIVKFMQMADFAIENIIVKDDDSVDTVFFVYKTANGNLVNIPFDEESTGTRRLFQIAVDFMVTIWDDDSILVFDEVGAELHPGIISNLLSLYFSEDNERVDGQIIFSTHMDDLMKILRRDQIYFTEKDKHTLSTTVYKMSDFDGIRKDVSKKNVYQKGIFGAYPYVTFDELMPSASESNADE